MDTPTPAPPPAPPSPPAKPLLERLLGPNWRSSVGSLGVAAEGIALVGPSLHGPAWLAYGHILFLVLIAAGFISAADAKRVAEIEASMKLLTAARPAAPPDPSANPNQVPPAAPPPPVA